MKTVAGKLLESAKSKQSMKEDFNKEKYIEKINYSIGWVRNDLKEIEQYLDSDDYKDWQEMEFYAEYLVKNSVDLKKTVDKFVKGRLGLLN